MKTLLTFVALSATLITSTAHAIETCENHIHVKVNGLVCDFCARALEKVFSKNENVDNIIVDLDKGVVLIHTNPGQTVDDETVTKLITDSGYNVQAIEKGC